MAIYTGGMRMQDEAKAASKRIAKQQAKAEKGEAKRKGRAGLFGKIAGVGLGALGSMALTAITGGALNPMTMKLLQAGIKGGSAWLGRAGAHQATTGKWGKQFKTPGQVDKIEAGGKYGYGRGDAKTLSEALVDERKSKEDWGTLAGDIGGSFMADVAGENLDEFTGDKLRSLLGKAPKPEFAGSPGAVQSDFDVSSFLSNEAPTEKLEMESMDFGGSSYDPDNPFNFQQGGQVPQKQLMALLALAQMQQSNAYSGTPLEEKQPSTIADHFASQGKTLGGNNTQSLSQMLGR